MLSSRSSFASTSQLGYTISEWQSRDLDSFDLQALVHRWYPDTRKNQQRIDFTAEVSDGSSRSRDFHRILTCSNVFDD